MKSLENGLHRIPKWVLAPNPRTATAPVRPFVDPRQRAGVGAAPPRGSRQPFPRQTTTREPQQSGFLRRPPPNRRWLSLLGRARAVSGRGGSTNGPLPTPAQSGPHTRRAAPLRYPLPSPRSPPPPPPPPAAPGGHVVPTTPDRGGNSPSYHLPTSWAGRWHERQRAGSDRAAIVGGGGGGLPTA